MVFSFIRIRGFYSFKELLKLPNKLNLMSGAELKSFSLERWQKTVSSPIRRQDLTECLEQKAVGFDSWWVVEEGDFPVLVDVELSQRNLHQIFHAFVGIVVLGMFD